MSFTSRYTEIAAGPGDQSNGSQKWTHHIMLLIALALTASGPALITSAAPAARLPGAPVAPTVKPDRKLVGYAIEGETSPPPPIPPPSPPPPPPAAPPPPVTVESRLPSVKTTGVPGAAAKIGAPGTVGGVSQVKAYTASHRRALSTTAPESHVAKCTSTSPAGCVSRNQPGYSLLNSAKSFQLVQVQASRIARPLPDPTLTSPRALASCPRLTPCRTTRR